MLFGNAGLVDFTSWQNAPNETLPIRYKMPCTIQGRVLWWFLANFGLRSTLCSTIAFAPPE
ncbi:MAG: hypothetical protein DWI00_01965 [Planctomycetota bacterium]|nr:MAG: hypothetical protein DWI00_01965 [Planctomycetota bacterium]